MRQKLPCRINALNFVTYLCSCLITFLPRLSFCFIVGALLHIPQSYAQSIQESEEIDRFIEQAKVKPYDCPGEENIEQIDSYLSSTDLLTEAQILALNVEKTHWMICNGDHTGAQDILTQIVESKNSDTSTEYYAAAVYQLGFIFDIQENAKRCDYYEQAKELSENRFDDVQLSAQLGLITVCNSNNDEAIKLGSLYSLLESYSNKADKAAIAHIHNNIGLLYGSLGQHVLAAEQYQKSYEMGLGTYTGNNQLATLISVISSHIGSGNFEAVKTTIEEFKRVNQQINTPLTNVWLHFAESGYHYRLGNFEELKNSLARWKIYLAEIDSQTYSTLYDWYHAAYCLSEKDKECVLNFLAAQEERNANNTNFLRKNKDYLKLLVDMHIFLGDIEAADKAFQRFFEVTVARQYEQQKSGKVLGVANLHSEIISLESSLEKERQDRMRAIASILIATFVVLGVLLFFLRRRYLQRITLDSVTGLLNSKSAISRIKLVGTPSAGRTNALALFDLRNFRDVNRMMGAGNSEETLNQIALSLKNATRERDILGRFAPEQFIVCLIDIEEDSAKSFFERIRYALENTMLGAEEKQNVIVRSSMSIYITSDTFDDMDDILHDMQMSLDINAESKPKNIN